MEGLDDMDDLDLLDATIDPTDVKTLKRVQQIQQELEVEQLRIKSKMLMKLALTPENPMRIDE